MKKVFDVNEAKGDILQVVVRKIEIVDKERMFFEFYVDYSKLGVRKINNTNTIEIKFKKNKKSRTEIFDITIANGMKNEKYKNRCGFDEFMSKEYFINNVMHMIKNRSFLEEVYDEYCKQFENISDDDYIRQVNEYMEMMG
jgi:hypothetical protein